MLHCLPRYEIIVSSPSHAHLTFFQMTTSEKHQKALLGGLERLVGVSFPLLLPSTPKILMAFYQSDLIDEEVAKAWGKHVSKKYVDKETSKKVRKAGEPFLKVSYAIFLGIALIPAV